MIFDTGFSLLLCSIIPHPLRQRHDLIRFWCLPGGLSRQYTLSIFVSVDIKHRLINFHTKLTHECAKDRL